MSLSNWFDKSRYEAINKMEIAANKSRTMEYAKKLGINVPETLILETADDLHRAEDTIGYPLVVKGSTEGGSVKYANDFGELESAFSSLQHDRPIAQQYIEGVGVGFFAAYNHGDCIAQFMHKRVREYPSSGGPSSAAQSFFSKELAQQGTHILDGLKWHGVAMVEFKLSSKDNMLYLMEINPKFWGSLELSIYAGIDFPFIASTIALGKPVSMAHRSYRRGVLFRWPFPGEFLHAMETGKYMEFVKNFFNRNYGDDIRLTDPVPSLFQLISTIRKARKRMSSR